MGANIPTAAKLRWLRSTLAASVERGGGDVASTWDREVLGALIADYERREKQEEKDAYPQGGAAD